ncbi:hypothetical protein DL93DRAFT_919198 [Clavulina sp. PMI_390]|nr:hypothetical protein DL93DRAFT_919198 [Clavulina sp. PMI_390]
MSLDLPSDHSFPSPTSGSQAGVEVPANGLSGLLRLRRPNVYDPRCIVVAVAEHVRREDGTYFLPRSVCSVNKVQRRFSRYGPILYTIAYEAEGSRSREYYIMFENPMPAASVYAESEHLNAPAGCSRLTLRSQASVSSSFGDWLARFCAFETKLPDDAHHLSCTHPIKKDANLFLRRATCTPEINPVPFSIHYIQNIIQESALPYAPQRPAPTPNLDLSLAYDQALLFNAQRAGLTYTSITSSSNSNVSQHHQSLDTLGFSTPSLAT